MAPKKAASSEKTISFGGKIPKLSLNMPLDAKRSAAILKCIEKGTLSFTISKVDLKAGKFAEPWIYD
jgi:hypothetical protein